MTQSMQEFVDDTFGPEGKKAEGSASTKPTHFLSYVNKDSGHKGGVGVAWLKPDGSISIKLNACVTIAAGEATVLTLFPRNEQDNRRGR